MKSIKLEISARVFVLGLLLFSAAAFATIAGTGSRFEPGENMRIKGTGSVTTCTLNGGTPSTCTATVLVSSNCQCTVNGASAALAAGGCAIGLSGTTLTVTSLAASTAVVNLHCF